MKFGKLEDISGVDFTLPPQDAKSLDYLQSLEITSKPEVSIYTGAPVWGHKEWIGKIYPKGTKQGDFLQHYARAFDTVELNTTYYRVPTKEMVIRWKDRVGSNFKFCPKVSQAISHSGDLQGPGTMFTEFTDSIRHFEENLGTTFLQLPPRFGPDKMRVLEAFLYRFPDEIPLAVEFRHPEWFPEHEVFDLLRSYNVGTVITDVAGRRDVVHSYVTSPSPFIRFAGNNLDTTDYDRINAWVDRLKTWIDAGVRELNFFVHEPNETHSPEMIAYLREKLNEVCEVKLPKVPLIAAGTQGTLF